MTGVRIRMLQVSRAALLANCVCHSVLRSLVSYQIPATAETFELITHNDTRVETLIVATIYLQLIQNGYMFRSFTVLQCSHQHCVQPVASDVEVVGYL